jgi:tetratricopeptide (TPR) repeat protein
VRVWQARRLLRRFRVRPRACSCILDSVGDEALAGEAAEFARCAETVEGAVRRFIDSRGTDPSLLYGETTERAVAFICQPVKLGSEHTSTLVAGLQAVARLHYARYHASPHQPAAFLWSAATLFRIIRHAPSVPVQVPADIELLLDTLAADDLTAVAGLGDLAAAADTATRIVQYASVTRDPGALSRAEELIRRVLDTAPQADPNQVAYLNTLLSILVTRCQWGSTDVAEELLALVDLADARAHHADPAWSALRANAGAACYALAGRTGNPALLDRSAGLIRSALSGLPADSPDTAGYLQNLGRAEILNWALRKDTGTLADAVAHLTQAVALTGEDDPHAADRHAWLAMALLSGDNPDPAAAARILQAADALPALPGARRDPGLLGQAWLTLWRARPDDSAALDRAIALLTQASAGPSHDDRGEGRDDLAPALWERWEKTHDLADIDAVIGRLTARAGEPDAPPLLLNLLARALRARWERTGDSVAIRHAIDCLATAVERSPAGAPVTSMYLNNLSAMWNRFYAATGDPAAVDSAVRYSRQALQSCADDDPDRPMYANNAALAMLHLAELTGSRPALEAAVAMSRYAADITPGGYPDRISHQVNLGAALARAAAHSGDTATLDSAVEALESAMRITPPAHQAYGGLVLTLGETLLSRSRRTGGDDTMAARGHDLIRQSAEVAHLRTETSILAARRWGEEAAELGDWKSAASALRRAVQRLAELPAHRLDRIHHEHLLIRLDGLATDTAAACCADGDSLGAVESLELGRGVLLAKTLRDDRTLAALRLREPALATRIADTQTALSAGPATSAVSPRF